MGVGEDAGIVEGVVAVGISVVVVGKDDIVLVGCVCTKYQKCAP